MQRLKERFAGEQFAVLAVNYGEADTRASEFLKRSSLDLTVLLDPSQDASRAWRVRVLPASFLVGDKESDIECGRGAGVRRRDPGLLVIRRLDLRFHLGHPFQRLLDPLQPSLGVTHRRRRLGLRGSRAAVRHDH